MEVRHSESGELVWLKGQSILKFNSGWLCYSKQENVNLLGSSELCIIILVTVKVC